MNIQLPCEVEYIISQLQNNNFEAYVVGGCVRDLILGRIPHDWDITTSAKPEEIKKVFNNEKIIETGLQHGTITLVLNKQCYEITTYRIDGIYLDKRRPDTVLFTNNLIEDLKRRDFTINAMAYNHQTGLIDPFHGLQDINNKIINCVGNPLERFDEDALRILRAIRFSAQLNFNISNNVDNAIRQQYKNLLHISIERVNSEFCKIVTSNTLHIQLDLYKDIFTLFIPELHSIYNFPQKNPWHIYDVFYHTIIAIQNCENEELVVKLAVLFHDIGKPYSYQDDDNGYRHFKGHAVKSADIVNNIMKYMKFDNVTKNDVIELIRYHDATINVEKKYIKRWLNKIGEKQFRRLLKVKKADNMAQNLNLSFTRIKELNEIEMLLNDVLKEKECFSLRNLAVNGNDLINIGYITGKELGDTLNQLLQLVINGQCANNKDELLFIANNLLIERRK